jgi:hypothetical protein
VSRTRAWGCSLLVAIPLAMSTIPDALAQTSAPPTGTSQGAAAQGAPAPGGFGQEISPTGEYQAGVPIGTWMLYPELFVGAVWDSNSNQASSNSAAQTATGSSPDSGTSLGVSPRLVATTNDGGMHATTLFGVGDFQFFSANTVAADAGFIHLYRPTEDLTLSLNLRYTRQTDLFTSALNFNNNAIGLQGGPAIPSPTIVNPFGTAPSINPVAYNQYTAGGSVAKTWDTWFTTLSGTAFAIDYDHANNIPAPFQTSQDGTSFWLDGKVGWHFVPSLYVFGEGAGIWQRFNNSIFNTNGYRVTGGLGADDPNSLVRGELYGGYQFQHQESQNVPLPNISPDAQSSVFGGRMYYFPTPYWTWTASVDEVLGMSAQLAPNIPQGVPAVVTTGILETTYGLSQQWSIGARVGYTRADYFDLGRVDNGWMAGASFNYEIWRNLHLTLDYQYSTLNSNTSFNQFSRNVVSAGVTYSY